MKEIEIKTTPCQSEREPRLKTMKMVAGERAQFGPLAPIDNPGSEVSVTSGMGDAEIEDPWSSLAREFN